MLKPTISDLLIIGAKSVFKNKSRATLTSLGIIIGVTSVILITSIGAGLENYINSEFESLGSNIIYVYPGKIYSDQGQFEPANMSSTSTFKPGDISRIKKELTILVDSIFPHNEKITKIKYGSITKNTTMVHTSAEYGKARDSLPSPGNGRWFTNEEDQKHTKVAVLAYQIARDLFGNQTPLNKKIIMGGKSLKVIGVIDKKGSVGMASHNADNVVYIPTSVGNDINGNDDILTITIKAKNGQDVETLKKEVDKIMKKEYPKEDAYSVIDQAQILSSVTSILSTLTLALSGIAAISLVVGGIGIMNIMLVTVSERTHEIGLRKAIGATPNAILVQFLLEAILLSLLGGLIGIILGVGFAQLINQFFPAKVTITSILTAFGVSATTGIVFGVTPARKAAKLSPIEALRYE